MKKIINKKFISVITIMLMFFSVFLVSTDKVLAADTDYFEWDLMTGYSIKAHEQAVFSGVESDNYFSLTWSPTNKIYFDTDHVYKIEFEGAPDDVVHIFDDNAMSVVSFSSGDSFKIFKKDLEGFGVAFHINETALFEHKGPYVFTEFTELKFYKRNYQHSITEDIEISEFSYEELAILSSGYTIKHPEFGWISKDNLKVGSEYLLAFTDGTHQIFRLLDKSGNKVKEGDTAENGKFVGLVFDFKEILSEGSLNNSGYSNILNKTPQNFKELLAYRSGILSNESTYQSERKFYGFYWNLSKTEINILEYYKTVSNRIKGDGVRWWLRDRPSGSMYRNYYSYIESNGEHSPTLITNDPSPLGLSPAFAFKNIIPEDSYAFYGLSGWDYNHLDEYQVNYVDEDSFSLNETTDKGQITFESEHIYKVIFSGANDSRLQFNHGIDTITFENGDVFSITKNYDDFVLTHNNIDYLILNESTGQIKNNDYVSDIKFLKLPLEESAPKILGEAEYITDLETENDIDYFINQLTILNVFDEDVTITVETDNYTQNKRVIDIGHRVVVRATDVSGNYTDYEFRVKVIDQTPPKITGDTRVAEVSYTNIFNVDAFKASLNVTDNHSLLTSDDVIVVSNEYLENETNLGTYTIVFKVADKSGNETTFEKQVKVIDDVKPEISGANKLTSNINTTIVISDVKKLLTAHDEIDGVLTNKIELLEDNYSGKGDKVGNYTLVYQVADLAGNTAIKTITLQRVDTIPKDVFVVDGSNIHTNLKIKLTEEEIIDILIATGEITVDSTTEVFVIEENYFGNEDQIGQYTIVLETRSTSGYENEHEVTINVTEERQKGTILNPAQKITDWIKNNPFVVIIFIVVVGALVLMFISPKTKTRKRKRR